MPCRFAALGLAAIACIVIWAVMPWSVVSAAPPPTVVVTVAPIHSLVAGVSEGISTPFLLLEGGVSPHRYAMKPSQTAALQEADLVVWVGEDLETFLARSLAAHGDDRPIITVMDLPSVTVYPARQGGVFHSAGDGHAAADHPHGDPHVWLDAGNARAIVDAVADVLAGLDPGNASQYRRNAAALRARIDALDARLTRTLAPLRDAPYVVFHDAYQGFERRYGLRAVGAVTVSPGRAPGAARLVALRETIKRLGARCVFSEPQFPPRLVATVTEGTGARSAVLDPLGADVAPGPEAWFIIMQRLATSLIECLGPR